MADGDTGHLGAAKFKAKYGSMPDPTRGLPACPPHLTGLASQAWEFLAEELADLDQDRRPDALMLEGACAAYQRAVQSDEAIQRDGIVVRQPIMDKHGECVGERLKTNPAVAISNTSWALVKSFCVEFGLSPVSRTRLTLEKKDDSAAELSSILASPRVKRAPVN